MAINARQLEVFRAVMRSGSLTAAARMLNVSQPAASKVLRYMETQLGYALFERVAGRLHPTAEAHLLFGDADRVFRELEAVRELAYRIKQNKAGLLRIGASAPPTFSLVPNAIRRFRAMVGPDVKVVVRTLPAAMINELIMIGDIDLGISLNSATNPLVKSELLSTTRIVAVVPEDSPLAALEVVRVPDIAGYELISYGSHAEIGALLDTVFEAEGETRRISIEISLSLTSLPLVQAGLGIALTDAMFPWESFAGVVARPFEPTVMMGVHLLTSQDRPLQRLASQFVGCLRHPSIATI
jgi:DNA-binding transcriptional LysR family regulator